MDCLTFRVNAQSARITQRSRSNGIKRNMACEYLNLDRSFPGKTPEEERRQYAEKQRKLEPSDMSTSFAPSIPPFQHFLAFPRYVPRLRISHQPRHLGANIMQSRPTSLSSATPSCCVRCQQLCFCEYCGSKHLIKDLLEFNVSLGCWVFSHRK